MMFQLQLQELEGQFQPSVLMRIHEDFFIEKGIQLYLKRDDVIHPVISGNKWRKLKYSINHALSLNKSTLISMGGAYSNHLHALAFAGKTLNLKIKAFIRGEKPALLNPTLQDLTDWGVELIFTNRSDYRKLRAFKTHNALPDLKPEEYWIPEGGYLPSALVGIAELVQEIDLQYDVICAACGTGTTLAGIINAVSENAEVLGFAVLKNADFLNQDVLNILTAANPFQDLPSWSVHKNWQINLDYHFGGFAKTTPALLEFIAKFEQSHPIVLEPVYTGKMLFGLYQLIAQDYFKKGQTIVAVHTGGLQGKRGFQS